MDTPVTGANTPLSLAELRQAVLAVVVGNPLFSEAEQLNLNHAAYEIDDALEMAHLLQGLRLKDAERGFMHRNYVAARLPQPGVCHCPATHEAELRDLRKHAGFAGVERSCLTFKYGISTRARLNRLGQAYHLLLEKQGKMSSPRGYAALLDN